MNKKVILIIGLVIIAGVGYGIFIASNRDSETTTRQVVGTTGPTTSANQDFNVIGREFVAQLLSIQSIDFNLNFFNDPVFRNLQDFSKDIQKQPVGRQNPFAPLGTGSSASPVTLESESTTTTSSISTPASTRNTSQTTRTTTTNNNSNSGNTTNVVRPSNSSNSQNRPVAPIEFEDLE